LIADRTREKKRVEKLLEDAQITLSVVASDIFGVSVRAMLNQLTPVNVIRGCAVSRPQQGNGSTGHGDPYLARVLGEAAVGASRTDTPTSAADPNRSSRPTSANSRPSATRSPSNPPLPDRLHVHKPFRLAGRCRLLLRLLFGLERGLGTDLLALRCTSVPRGVRSTDRLSGASPMGPCIVDGCSARNAGRDEPRGDQ